MMHAPSMEQIPQLALPSPPPFFFPRLLIGRLSRLNPERYCLPDMPSPYVPRYLPTGPQRRAARHELHVDNIDYQLKIMHSAWHPTRPVLALAAVNNLYLFRQ